MTNIDYSGLPDYMRDGIRNYLEHGLRPGDFLLAVLSNDLMEAFVQVDDVNRAAMHDWVRFLYNHAPRNSWGSPDLVDDWVRLGGIKGAHKQAASATVQ